MTKDQLAKLCAAAGVTLHETASERAITILIDAPDNKRFAGTLTHVLVTQWYSNFAVARADAYDDLLKALPLEDCPVDCECHDDDKEPDPDINY